MSDTRTIQVPVDWRRRECRTQVVAFIKASQAPNGHKRAAFLKWLIFVGEPTANGVLDEVITTRHRAAPTAAELR